MKYSRTLNIHNHIFSDQTYFQEALDIGEFIAEDNSLKQKIISIYGIGSFAKGTAKENSDIDLNIFIRDCDGSVIFQLNQRCYEATSKYGRKIDVNIITEESFSNGIITSDYFVQKNRHALFIYELVTYKFLIYGEDILKDIHFNVLNLFGETFKLLHTLSYRLSKLLLAKNPSYEELSTQCIKYTIYACEFMLINKGILVNRSINVENTFFDHFSYLEISEKFLREIFIKRKLRNYHLTTSEISQCYDVIATLCREVTSNFNLVRNYTLILISKNDENITKKLKQLLEKYSYFIDTTLIKLLVSEEIKSGEVVIKCNGLDEHSLKLTITKSSKQFLVQSNIILSSVDDLEILFKYRKIYE